MKSKLFFEKKPEKKYLRIELTKDNTMRGLMQLLSLCRVKSPGLSFNAFDLIRWMDNYMIAFRQAVYTKRMLLSSTGRFIRKIRRMDISIENTSDDEFLQVFKSMLSFTPKYKDRIVPAVTSENILLLHSTYYCLYEYLFLKEKTVSKQYPPIVPLYMQRLIEK